MAVEQYLFIGDLKNVKDKIQKHKTIFTRLLELCKTYERVVLSSDTDTSPGFAVVNLALLTLLNGERRWLEESKRWIFHAVNQPDWDESDEAELLFGIGLALSWLDKLLLDEEKEQISIKLLSQCRSVFSFINTHQKESWPGQYWFHHNWMNYTGFVTAAYALKKYSPAESKEWTERTKENFKTLLPLLPDDGSNYEGITKWKEGILWLLMYAHLVRDEEGLDLFKDSSYLKNTFYYRLYQCSPVFEQHYNFGNCHDKRGSHSIAVYYKLASEYGIKEAQWMGDNILRNFLYREHKILPEAFLELLWFNPGIDKKAPTNLPKSRFFPDQGLLSCRSSWAPDAFAFAVKAGAPGGNRQWDTSWKMQGEEGFSRRNLSNQHADDGSIILWKGLNNYVVDEGFNREISASNHNMILFDGKGYIGDGKKDVYLNTKYHQKPEILTAIKKNELIYMVMDLSPMYDQQLQVEKLKRHFFYCGKNSLLIFDEVKSSNTETISWQIHTEDFLKKSGNQYKTDDGDFILTPLLRANLVSSRETKVINSTPTHRSKMENLTLHTTNTGDTTYFLKHIDTGCPYDKVEFEELMDENWVGVSITRGTMIDTIFLAKNPENGVRKSFPGIEGESDASFVYLIEKDGELENSMYLGDYLNLSGIEIDNNKVDNMVI